MQSVVQKITLRFMNASIECSYSSFAVCKNVYQAVNVQRFVRLSGFRRLRETPETPGARELCSPSFYTFVTPLFSDVTVAQQTIPYQTQYHKVSDS